MIRVEWVEVADGVGDSTSNLVSQALDGLSIDAARGGHYLLDLDAAERPPLRRAFTNDATRRVSRGASAGSGGSGRSSSSKNSVEALSAVDV